jgi:Leu/Phe-tRNA-protein transferase
VIPDLISLILEYARYSELEKVVMVLADADEFFFGGFYTMERSSDNWNERQWMGICVPPQTADQAAKSGIFTDWKEGDQHIYYINFGDAYNVYEYEESKIQVTLDELLPSNKLAVVVHDEFKEILAKCRDQYLDRMSLLISQIYDPVTK